MLSLVLPRARERTLLLGMLVGGAVVAVSAHELLPSATARPRSRRNVGTLVVEVRDDAGQPLPARLTFRPAAGTPKLFFTTTDIAREELGAVAAFDRAFVLRGDAELRVPAGTYDVDVSHGPEWDAVHRRVVVRPNGDVELNVKLHHVVDLPGWISGDFHVHAAPSLDSRVPLRDRIHQFVADGVDLIVSTDHNIVSDYRPIIDELGVGDLITSSTGDEITTKSWGHFGAFPMVDDEQELGHGAPATGNRTPSQIFADVRARAPGTLIDVHHPRLEHSDIGYFHLAELDGATGQARRPGYSSDFDAIEVLNGYQDPDHKSVDKVIGDWLGFLDRGQRVTATGNSDTHHMTFNLGGYPRNYVQVGDVPLAQLDATAVATAVKEGHAFFTTGPLVEGHIDGAGFGDTVTAAGGHATLHVRVHAAPWISTSKLTILGRDGAILATHPIAPSTAPLRLDEDLPLTFASDGYVVIRVDGDRPMAPNVGDEVGFRVYPFALTNPIWVDADGDGKVTPPGAPKPPRKRDKPGRR
jgi:hypothetical protein